MNLVINPTQRIIITFEGTEYPCSKPSLGAVMDMEVEIAKAKAEGKSGTHLVVMHLTACGLPEGVVMKLDMDQLDAVTGALMPAKKN